MLFCNRVPSVGAFLVCVPVVAASVLKARNHQAPDPAPPRMYVAEGCDGSTATLDHAFKILALHGINAGSIVTEQLIDINNVYWEKSGHHIEKAMQMLNEEIRSKGQTMVFKSILHRDMQPTTSPILLGMGTMAVYVTRKNPLDQLVCMVRDCFLNIKPHGPYGNPVTSTGEDSDLCFERRAATATAPYKAKLKVVTVYPTHNRSWLSENLEKMETFVSTGYQELLKAGYTGPKLWYEDMMAFEKGGDANLETSLETWQKLLEAWGVNPNKGKLEQYLKSYQNGFWSQQRQQDEIWNYDEVKAEVIRLGRTDLLRN